MPDDSPPRAGGFPLAAADLCVKCGLCLPHCPTYRETQNEAQSPRGRIALMQGLATGLLAPGAALQGHLDGCLTCRACEAVCPAHVPYGRLIDAAREGLAAQDPRRARAARMIAVVLARRPLRFAVAVLLWLYQHLGLQRLVRATRLLGRGSLARLDSLLPRVHLPRLPRGSAGSGLPAVALFANCTSPLVEPETLDAAVSLLERLGCAVSVPAAQGCCGALHQHAGLVAGARLCATANVAAFAAADAVVGIASGCTAQLLEYDEGFARKVRDLHAFIATHPALPGLAFEPLHARVLLHTPCTLRNVVGGEHHVRALLERIPGLQVDMMDVGCCGAAGSYVVTQPAMADALVASKVAQADALQPAFVLSSNVGCALHLSAALARAGITAAVWHPLRLLARQARASAPRAATAAAPPARPG
jgi:glycolate oxidase iron-sulfur subunit